MLSPNVQAGPDLDSMTDATAMNEKQQEKQFWLRVLLTVGMLWGFLPFIMVPYITKGQGFTDFDIMASVLNSLTVLPASALAFWHRRIACVWLSVNAVVLPVALATYIERTGRSDGLMIAEVAGPVLIALCLDVIEALRWPAAKETRTAKALRG